MIIEVPSSKGGTYKVDTISLTCTCPDFTYRQSKTGGVCKHIQKVLADLSEQTENISNIY